MHQLWLDKSQYKILWSSSGDPVVFPYLKCSLHVYFVLLCLFLSVTKVKLFCAVSVSDSINQFHYCLFVELSLEVETMGIHESGSYWSNSFIFLCNFILLSIERLQKILKSTKEQIIFCTRQFRIKCFAIHQ